MASCKFEVNGFLCPNAEAVYAARSEAMFPLEYWSRVNSVCNYRGHRPGEAHLLITRACYDDLTSHNQHVITLTNSSGVSMITIIWQLVHCEAIETAPTGEAEFYYAKFLDGRHAGDMGQVFDTYALITNAIKDTMTWPDVLTALWDSMCSGAKGGSFAAPAFPSARASKAANLNFDGIGVWTAICQALEACGLVAVFDQETGGYSWKNYDDTQSGLAAARTAHAGKILWNGNCPAVPTAASPYYININFPPFLHNELTDGSYTQPHTEEVASGITGAYPNTRIVVVDTMMTRWLEGFVQNNTDLDNRVTDLKRTIKGKARAASNKSTIAYRDWIFYDFAPGEEITEVHFVESARRGVYTHVVCYEPFELKLPKPQLRRYSNIEVIEILGEADSNGNFPIKIKRLDLPTNTLIDKFEGVGLDINGSTDVDIGRRFLGVQIGRQFLDGAHPDVATPTYAFDRHCTQRVEIFTLLTNWYNGVAIAQFTSFGDPTYSETGIVEDPLGIFNDIMHAGDSGYSVKTCDPRHLAIQAKCKQGSGSSAGTVGKCTIPTSRGGGTPPICIVTTRSICESTSYPGVGINGTYHGDGTTCP